MTEEFDECPHGRLKTAYCGTCAETLQKTEEDSETIKKLSGNFEEKVMQPSGLDAPYYDIPDDVNTMQDMIEFLNLDFGNGNILKSLVRENNPNAKKETTALYEAQKRFYYADRHLRRVQAMQEDSEGGE